ncbi:hypothetical protein [Methanohalophilus halophilus]|uniref:Uncharacterized protein n=1 Tax=Methanohalophilus halophilus TaxID=2177 RepID=A0A1L3Q4F2_9EURY|nr:hypothetical protein [Methanohalophilus halophilus]APH39641.1 hypothetical protein BHR79_09210 [Methanohalophilus halophilus]RNI09023.1 hypothetical protein EFE40_06055 [Methanohalophilus halophilus]SDW34202.1 hypothetical protein SAMN04515625_0755 [Methanohalophilus halophilus]
MSPRKKDEKKYTKYVGIFLAVIMVGSIGMFFFSGAGNNNNNEQTSENGQVSGFESVPGEHIEITLNSIQDGLQVTPDNVTTARYMNIASLKGTPLQYLTGNTSVYNNFYGSNVTKLYSAGYDNSSWIEMHEIDPKVVAFQYYTAPETYKGYQPLSRGQGIYNVIGTPMVLGEQQSVEDTIDVIEGDAESAQKFNEILQFASTDAPIQQVVDLENEFADQYYVEWDIEDDNSFRRTALYADPTENTMTNLTTRASNTSQRGLNYNITEYGNIIKVDITANASNFYAMAMEPIQ